MAQEIQRPSNGPATPRLEFAGDNPFGNGFWVARFEAQYMPRVAVELVRMAIRGPVGSHLEVHVDGRYALSTTRASLNDWAGKAVPIEPGAPLVMYWNTGNTPQPFVNLFLRTK